MMRSRLAPPPPDKAQRVAEEVAGYENRLASLDGRVVSLDGRINLLQWMAGFNIALTVAALLKLFH
jgi:hypothetical protein